MKHNFKFLALAILIVIASCSKDETSSSPNENDQAIETLEKTPLAANDVADNVVISGSIKNEGTPPTPNEAISLDISNSSGTAFLNEGFEVSLNSDADIAGAYLQFKSNDGEVSDSFYDIDINANAFGKEGVKISKISEHLSKRTSKNDDKETLDVDFTEQLEPGTFCYLICVYDADGNISAPEELCVTVEAWGGFGDLVGEWNYVRQEITFEGETEVFEFDDPDCDVWTIDCQNNQGTVEVSSCFGVFDAVLELKENGNYVFQVEGDIQIVDLENSSSQCELVLEEDENYIIRDEGNWAYVLDEQRLTLVSYSSTEISGDQEYTDTYEPGEGFVLYDGNAELDGNSFILTESEDYDGDGVVDTIVKFYFEK